MRFSMMAENDVSGVILPTTAYILKLVPPPVRKMIDAGVNVALASDFNPNGKFCKVLINPEIWNIKVTQVDYNQKSGYYT